jgi:hypothetical protein
VEDGVAAGAAEPERTCEKKNNMPNFESDSANVKHLVRTRVDPNAKTNTEIYDNSYDNSWEHIEWSIDDEPNDISTENVFETPEPDDLVVSTVSSKPDGILLALAKKTWHSPEESNEPIPEALEQLEPPRIALEQLVVRPLCNADARAASLGPNLPVPRLRNNKTVRTRSESPTTINPGWEHAPGVPQSGTFRRLLDKVRANDATIANRQQQAFHTYLALSAASESRSSGG